MPAVRRALLLVIAIAGCGDNAVAPPDAARAITLRAVTPARGGLPGGTTIVLDGDGFDPAAPPTIVVGRALATEVGVIDAHTITATTPRGALAGAVDVVVAGGGAHARLDRGFTYNALPAITAIDPPRGDAAGGTRVTITGAGFVAEDAGAADVRFGDLRATGVTVVSDTELTATTPPGPPFAEVGVTVANRNGESSPISSFRYVARGLIVGSNRYGAPMGLFFVDPTSGLTTRIRPITAADPALYNAGVHALANDGHLIWGTTHTFQGTPQLFSFDPMTLELKVVDTVTDSSTQAQIDCRDLEWIAGALVCVQYGSIYTVDLVTAHATLRSTTNVYRISLAALGDTTYAITGPCCAQATFSTVDLDTGVLGAPIPITANGMPLTVGAGKATAMDGALYLIGSAWFGPEGGDVPAGTTGRGVYRVDVTTGDATLVGRVPFQTTALTAITP